MLGVVLVLGLVLAILNKLLIVVYNGWVDMSVYASATLCYVVSLVPNPGLDVPLSTIINFGYLLFCTQLVIK